jgi:dTDP-4-dehydrorhamnose reductase
MLPKLLITPARSPLGQSLLNLLTEYLSAYAELVVLTDEIDTQGMVCVLNVSMLNADAGAALAETHRVVQFCATKNIPLIHLSSYLVFGADKKNVHNEKDQPLHQDSALNPWLEAEDMVSAQIAKHIILRTSWLIASQGENPLTRLLSAFLDGAQVHVHRGLRGAPTTIDDFSRVIAAVIKQLFCTAENWGVMHYCSSDHCSEEEFAEQVLQYLIQYQLLTAEPSLQLVDSDEEEHSSAILGCRRLRDGFGIQARSWRPYLLLLIKDWLGKRNQVSQPVEKSHQ